jgi:hypothetical protein
MAAGVLLLLLLHVSDRAHYKQVRASSMLACENTECCRRFCEHCLLTHLNEDVDPMSSDAWSVSDGKVCVCVCVPEKTRCLCCFQLESPSLTTRNLGLAAGLALPDMPQEVLLLCQQLRGESQALQGERERERGILIPFQVPCSLVCVHFWLLGCGANGW